MLPFLVTTGSPHFWSATGLAKGYEDASYLLCIDCTFVMRSDIVSGCFRLVGWVAGWVYFDMRMSSRCSSRCCLL